LRDGNSKCSDNNNNKYKKIRQKQQQQIFFYKMCDVTRQNFDTLKPEMLNNINRCDFIAFDTEFSALTISEDYKTRCENVKIEIFIAAYQRTFLPALVRTTMRVYVLLCYPRRVGTYVQRGSKYCFVVVETLLENYIFGQFHHAFTCSLVRQPCLAALSGSLVWQPCLALAALSGSLVW
jgi:hypothetical protein